MHPVHVAITNCDCVRNMMTGMRLEGDLLCNFREVVRVIYRGTARTVKRIPGNAVEYSCCRSRIFPRSSGLSICRMQSLGKFGHLDSQQATIEATLRLKDLGEEEACTQAGIVIDLMFGVWEPIQAVRY